MLLFGRVRDWSIQVQRQLSGNAGNFWQNDITSTAFSTLKNLCIVLKSMFSTALNVFVCSTFKRRQKLLSFFISLYAKSLTFLLVERKFFVAFVVPLKAHNTNPFVLLGQSSHVQRIGSPPR